MEFRNMLMITLYANQCPFIYSIGRVFLIDCVDLIRRFRVFLATLPLGFNCGFIFTSAWGWSTGVCPCEGQVWRWCSCLGLRGSGSARYSGELAARAARNIVLWKGMSTSLGQYAPVFLPGEPPF